MKTHNALPTIIFAVHALSSSSSIRQCDKNRSAQKRWNIHPIIVYSKGKYKNGSIMHFLCYCIHDFIFSSVKYNYHYHYQYQNNTIKFLFKILFFFSFFLLFLKCSYQDQNFVSKVWKCKISVATIYTTISSFTHVRCDS